jgi:hypothetical protein
VLIDNEITGSGAPNTTVDWSIRAPGEPRLLLEVKNRTFDLVESFEEMYKTGPDWEVPRPAHDHRKLFRNVAKKFMARQSDNAIRAVWITAGLLQEESKLKEAFQSLEVRSLHAAILGDWSEEAYLLAIDRATANAVRRILRLKQSRRFVFIGGM